MGTTASTKTNTKKLDKKTNEHSTQSTYNSALDASGNSKMPKSTGEQEIHGKQHKREELQRRLRSKIRAVVAIRKSVRLTVEDNDTNVMPEEDRGNPPSSGQAQQEEGAEETGNLRALDILYHPNHNREELRQFLRQAREEAEECWDDIQNDGSNVSDKYSVIPGQKENRNSDLGRGTNWRNKLHQDVAFERRLPPPMLPVENDIRCALCDEVAAFHLPCRICPRVYHRDCLDTSTQYHDADRVYMDQANTARGWSCHQCDDLCLLLSPAEIAEMMEDFDKCDVNRDESITLEEFVRYKTRQYLILEGKNIPEEDEGLLRAQFARMDTDGSNAVDWWEFVRFEARRYLARKLEKETVALLTPKEQVHARDVYMALLMGRELEDSYLQGVYLDSRILTWEDFLYDQALYMLWSRPNREHIIFI